MGGDVPSAGKSMARTLQAYIQYLPELMNVTSKAEIPTEANLLKASQGISSGYNELGLDQLQKFALPYAEEGQAVNRSDALAQAETNKQLLTGSGADAARAASSLQDEIAPEGKLAASRMMDLLSSINLNGLSGGERSEVERSLNRSNTATGNLGLDNATNAVSNAMNFGSAIEGKRTSLGNALNTSTNVMNSLNARFNPTAVALTPPAANPAATSFTPVTKAGGVSSQFGSGLLGNLSGIASANIAPRAQASYDYSGTGATNNAIGSVCCFIFLEAYNGMLPPSVRECRDFYYEQLPQIAKGYKRMAKWLVPLMRHSKVVTKLVNDYMVKPLTKHGEWMTQQSVHGREYRSYRNFWFKIWNTIGGF